MSMPYTGDPAGWKVTSQTEFTEVNPGGEPVKGVKVFFSTSDGHSGSVFIPYSRYNPEYVRQQIGLAAANMNAVGALTGTIGQA